MLSEETNELTMYFTETIPNNATTTTIAEGLLCARHWAEHFRDWTQFICYSPQEKPLWSAPLHRQGKQGLVMVSHVLKGM
jgi:hypothetical protein